MLKFNMRSYREPLRKFGCASAVHQTEVKEIKATHLIAPAAPSPPQNLTVENNWRISPWIL